MKTNKKSGIIFTGIILTMVIILLIILTMEIDSIHIKKIEKYLQKQNYNDEFSNIEFVESGEYKVRVTTLAGKSNALRKLGTYKRYKVHANKANIDFFVQYLDLDSSSKRYQRYQSGYEDDYMVTKNINTITNGLENILKTTYGYNSQIKFDGTSASDEIGELNNDFWYFLEIDIDEPIENICTQNHLEQTKNFIKKLTTLIENTYIGYDNFSTLNIDFINSDYDIRFSCGIDSNNKGEISIYYHFYEENEKTIKYKNIIEEWYKNNELVHSNVDIFKKNK